jgi:outer membrane protein OmpA-like peptidoglycan-associated protein
LNKKTIYEYNFRHKEMDYSLYGRGDLNIVFEDSNSNSITQIKEPEPPAPKTDTLKLGDVFFDFNKANLKPDAIKKLAAYFKTNNSTIDSIYIEGHTDSIGSDARNLTLSKQRSESVKQWFLKNSVITNDKIEIHPFGKYRPVATNKTVQGRAMNRRVEIVIFRKLQ